MTNVERLNLKTSEEIKNWVLEIHCEKCPVKDKCESCSYEECVLNIAKWLYEEEK